MALSLNTISPKKAKFMGNIFSKQNLFFDHQGQIVVGTLRIEFFKNSPRV